MQSILKNQQIIDGYFHQKKEIERLYIYSNNKIKNLSNNRSLVLHEYWKQIIGRHRIFNPSRKDMVAEWIHSDSGRTVGHTDDCWPIVEVRGQREPGPEDGICRVIASSLRLLNRPFTVDFSPSFVPPPAPLLSHEQPMLGLSLPRSATKSR